MKWVCVPGQLLGQAFQGLQRAWPCALPLAWICSRRTFREKSACPGCKGASLCSQSKHEASWGAGSLSSLHTHTLLRPQAHPKGLGRSSSLCCSVLSQTMRAFIIFEQGPSAPVASLVQMPGPSRLPDEEEWGQHGFGWVWCGLAMSSWCPRLPMVLHSGKLWLLQ